MTAQELYKAIGVAGYETLACWRKEGVFHLRLSPPASQGDCAMLGNLRYLVNQVLGRGLWDTD